MASSLTSSGQWKALADHYATIKDVHLRQWFADDPTRGQRLAVEGAGLYLELFENRISSETIELLVALAVRRDLPVGPR